MAACAADGFGALLEGRQRVEEVCAVGVRLESNSAAAPWLQPFANAAANEIEDTIARNFRVVRKDVGICIEMHRSYATCAYSARPLSPRHEVGVAYFQNRLKQNFGIDGESCWV